MDLQKAKILLEKINALYKNMNADKKNISTIEKDLMKSYIQQFYEVFLEMPASARATSKPSIEIFKSTPKVAPRNPVIKKAAPAPLPTSPKPDPAPEVVERVVPVIEKQVSPPPAPKQVPPSPAPAAPTPTKRKAAPATIDSSEMEGLFAFNSAKELSEKLSEMPIKDIKKAMGLNERIFTVNELFGGDQAAFDMVTTSLNGLSSFEAAKRFLIQQVAAKYKWTAKGKKNKAKNFIKLVKRRYN